MLDSSASRDAGVAGRQRPIIVQKYGGSSVADVEKIGRVADRVCATRREGNDVVVVVSAMGKTTDSLLTLARQAAVTPEGPTDPPRRELDMLLSTGERVSMALLSIAIQARGLEAISFTGSQSGILTNDRHFDARIIEVRPHRIEDEIARGKIVIVAGYQGMSYRREITTLGRGGSDTTAVALAAALRADRCEIYSDVDGVYSADPRAVPDAKHVPELDHAILQEMAENGAKVICAQAVEWARRAGIAIYARSTFATEPGARQTVIREMGASERAGAAGQGGFGARAIVAEKDVVLAKLPAGIDPAWLAEAMGPARIAFKDLSIGPGGGTAVVPLLNVPDWSGARRALLSSAPGVELVEGVCTVGVVGDGLASSAEPIARFFAALRAAGAEPIATTAGPLRLGAVVRADTGEAAQRALHAAFVS